MAATQHLLAAHMVKTTKFKLSIRMEKKGDVVTLNEVWLLVPDLQELLISVIFMHNHLQDIQRIVHKR